MRSKNAELQRAIDAVRGQLSKIAPRLSANVKRKHSNENERLNRLQQEASMLQQEQTGLLRKLRDVEHVKELEKQLASRVQEVKNLQERNKFLQLEIRANSKKLKQAANIEEYRAQVLTEIKQERKLAMVALERAQKDVELAAQSRETAQKRLAALELRDRLPELRNDDIKQLLEMKNSLSVKMETIESLQYRLSVLKRAHESVNRAAVTNPGELAEVETLKAEVAALKAALASAANNPESTSTIKATRKKPKEGRRSSGTAAADHAPATATDNIAAETARREEEHLRKVTTLVNQESEGRQAIVRASGDEAVSMQARERHDRAELSSRPARTAPGVEPVPKKTQPVEAPAPVAAAPPVPPPATTPPSKSSEPAWLDD